MTREVEEVHEARRTQDKTQDGDDLRTKDQRNRRHEDKRPEGHRSRPHFGMR
jgi:hypothetical protein